MKKVISIFILFLTITSCAKSRLKIVFSPDTPLWQAAKELSIRYEEVETRQDRLAIAKRGIEYGRRCIKEEPENPACYYYHAINTGLYYQTRVIGYQNGLKSMIADCEKVLKLDPAFDHGGAYRILGRIYTEVPYTTSHPGGITRDLEKAEENSRKAVAIAPGFPENHLVLSRALLEAKRNADAALALSETQQLMPSWREHHDYPFWKQETRKLAKKLKRYIKGLQSGK